jgi:hypothetical protein
VLLPDVGEPEVPTVPEPPDALPLGNVGTELDDPPPELPPPELPPPPALPPLEPDDPPEGDGGMPPGMDVDVVVLQPDIARATATTSDAEKTGRRRFMR